MSKKCPFKIGDVVVRARQIDVFNYGTLPVKIIGFDHDNDLILEGEDMSENGGWIWQNFDFYDKEQGVIAELEQALDKATEVFGKERLAEMLSDKLTKGSTNE